jgi:hypothetical protein
VIRVACGLGACFTDQMGDDPEASNRSLLYKDKSSEDTGGETYLIKEISGVSACFCHG